MRPLYVSSERPHLENRYENYLNLEKSIIRFLKNNGCLFYKLSKPEIYKHPIAFKFLNNFTNGTKHLIIRIPHNIRILKGAVNIAILPIAIKRPELENDDSPFKNYRRMFSIVDEVWTTHKDNWVLFEKDNAVTMKYFDNERELLVKIAALS